MKEKICIHKTVRLLSMAALPLLALVDVLLKRRFCTGCFCVDVYCALQMLMLYPVNKDPVRPSLAASAFSLALFLILKVLYAPGWLIVLAAQLAVLCFSFRKIKLKYAEVQSLFHTSAVWRGVEDYMMLYHISVFLAAGSWLTAAQITGRGLWVLLGFETVLYGLQYYRVFTRSTLLLGTAKEEEIKKCQKTPEYKVPVQYVDSDSRSASLYNDVIRIMETKKPYLQDDFSVDDLARMTRTNRMYLSRAINFHSGRNFNQLINYYRIKYAVELIKKDSNLKMNELSQMCGFHTVVSFNMAFKLNERMTPSEYARSLKKIT